MEHEVATSVLEECSLPYTAIPHARAFTAQEVAKAAHITGKDLAKTVIVWADERLAMAVLHADERLNLKLLQEALGAREVRLATESEFVGAFPDCEPGAMPPFGNRYGMSVVVSPSIAVSETITFNAGSHTELVRMNYSDFERMVQPRVAAITRQIVI